MKKIPYGTTLGERIYRFGFVETICENGIIHRQFVKHIISQTRVDSNLRAFLKCHSEDFWISYGGCRHELINWVDGDLLKGKDKKYARKVLGDALVDDLDAMSNGLGFDTRKASFVTNLFEMSFTEIVMLCRDLRDLDYGFINRNQILFETLKIAMYQYIRAGSWWTRRKVLKVLKEDEFLKIDYQELEKAFKYISENEWKYS